MVTCNAHNLVIGSSNLSTALKIMNYSSMVEQSTHNGCISVQFWVIQNKLNIIMRTWCWFRSNAM